MFKRFILTMVAFLFFVATAIAAINININTADEKALEQLPGIGPGKAKAIVEYRTQHGSYKNINELLKVKGIGPNVLEKIRDQVEVETTQKK
jgi:competence protein ComEA